MWTKTEKLKSRLITRNQVGTPWLCVLVDKNAEYSSTVSDFFLPCQWIFEVIRVIWLVIRWWRLWPGETKGCDMVGGVQCCAAVWSDTIRCNFTQCDTIPWDRVKCDTVGAILCNTVTLYNATLYIVTGWSGTWWVQWGVLCDTTVYDVTRCCAALCDTVRCDTVRCSAVWHGAVTDHPDPNTHNPSNTHCHILWQLQNKIHSFWSSI